MRKSKISKVIIADKSSGYEDFFEQAVISFCFLYCTKDLELNIKSRDFAIKEWKEKGLIEGGIKEFKRDNLSLYGLICHIVFDL